MPTEEIQIFRIRPNFIPYFFILTGIMLVGGFLAYVLYQIEPLMTLSLWLAIVFADLIIFLSWLTTVYTLTTVQALCRVGIIGSREEFIEIEQISSAELSQSVIGRFLNFGDVIIKGDSERTFMVFRGVANPRTIHHLIEQTMIQVGGPG